MKIFVVLIVTVSILVNNLAFGMFRSKIERTSPQSPNTLLPTRNPVKTFSGDLPLKPPSTISGTMCTPARRSGKLCLVKRLDRGVRVKEADVHAKKAGVQAKVIGISMYTDIKRRRLLGSVGNRYSKGMDGQGTCTVYILEFSRNVMKGNYLT